jgi:transglutaminase-like putative cysteine protease
MHLDIEHDIKFSYDDFISESWVELRMEAQSNIRQSVNLFCLAVGPRAKVSRYIDWAGNAVRHFSIAEYHKEIEVRTRTIVETKPNRITLDSVKEPTPERGSLGPIMDFLEFGGPIQMSRLLKQFNKALNLEKSKSVGEQVRQIGNFVHDQIKYKANVTTYRSTIDEALTKKAGVCQDMGQIMIGLLRLAGIPARYVNGYLHVPNLESGTAESHAWIEFHSSEFGWVGYDPTGNLQPGENHVMVATGRHYDEVPPNRGVYRGTAKEQLTAVVRTKVIPAPEFNTFREEIQEIPLPVYSEVPDRLRPGMPEDQTDQFSQQQQQQ